MSKITCIIDTSSYINLDAFLYYKGTLLSTFSRNAVIKISPEVNHEIIKHEQESMPNRQKRQNQIYHPQMFRIDDYQNILWGEIRQRSAGSRGEIENFIVALDLFLSNSIKSHGVIVFLTDDDRALRGLLEEVIHAFPYNAIWCSYDVVLYLYLIDRAFLYDIARNAIQHIYSSTSTNDDRMDPVKNRERLRIKTKYEKLLDKVKTLKTHR